MILLPKHDFARKKNGCQVNIKFVLKNTFDVEVRKNH